VRTLFLAGLETISWVCLQSRRVEQDGCLPGGLPEGLGQVLHHFFGILVKHGSCSTIRKLKVLGEQGDGRVEFDSMIGDGWLRGYKGETRGRGEGESEENSKKI
jgi:hypothetical protein